MSTERTISKRLIQQYQEKLKLIRESGGTINPNETKQERLERIERAKNDFAFMVQHYFPHYAESETPDFHVKFAKKVKKNQTIKAFAQWGRGLAKSVVCDVLIPFWLHINGEPVYLVIIGRNNERAVELLADLQAEFEANPRIISDFGEQKIYGDWADGDFRTKTGFIGKALGMGQSVRGLRVRSQRPNLCICDDIEERDLVKNPKRQDEMAEWIERGLIPTMDGPIRRFLYANNLFAPRMTQTVLQDKHPNWLVHQVNAYNPVDYKPIWTAKYSDDYYRELVEGDDGLGTLAANAEYNNTPHVEGKVFTDEQIQWCKLPNLNHMKHIVGFWDVAYAGNSTSDYNAVRVWGAKDKDFFYIDSFVKQSKMKAAVEWMAAYQKDLPKSVRVHWRFEAQFWNDEVERVIREVEKVFGITLNIVKSPNPKGKKYDRILSLQPYYQNGRIYYNDKKKGHNDTLVGLAQLKGIEPGYKTKDDAPDADQQAIEYLSEQIKISNYEAPRRGQRHYKNRY